MNSYEKGYVPQEDKTTVEVQLALIHQDLLYVKGQMTEMKALLVKDYVTRNEFDPIRRVVYGMVGIILIGVVASLLTLVLKK